MTFTPNLEVGKGSLATENMYFLVFFLKYIWPIVFPEGILIPFY